jgi:hypothetical protein
MMRASMRLHQVRQSATAHACRGSASVTNAARFLPFFMLSDMFMERAKEISVSSPST